MPENSNRPSNPISALRDLAEFGCMTAGTRTKVRGYAQQLQDEIEGLTRELADAKRHIWRSGAGESYNENQRLRAALEQAVYEVTHLSSYHEHGYYSPRIYKAVVDGWRKLLSGPAVETFDDKA